MPCRVVPSRANGCDAVPLPCLLAQRVTGCPCCYVVQVADVARVPTGNRACRMCAVWLQYVRPVALFTVGVHCYGFVPVGSITTPCCSRFNMSLYSAKYIPSVCRLSISTNVLRPVKLPMRSRLFALYGCACRLSL